MRRTLSLQGIKQSLLHRLNVDFGLRIACQTKAAILTLIFFRKRKSLFTGWSMTFEENYDC